MNRRLAFDADGWADCVYWLSEDRKILKRLNALIVDALRDPFDGIGKPEPLKHRLGGAWSRRIDDTNRLVCLVTDDEIRVLQARYHY